MSDMSDDDNIDLAYHQARYDGKIVGWIYRGGKTVSFAKAGERAKTMPWWREGLTVDKRDQKWWVWRERG